MQKGGDQVKAAERREAIIEILCERRREKIANLAFEFNVSERTIRNDIIELSLIFPIYTVAGRYNSGVFIADGYRYKKFLSLNQKETLVRLSSSCSEEDKKVLEEIILCFGKNNYGGM